MGKNKLQSFSMNQKSKGEQSQKERKSIEMNSYPRKEEEEGEETSSSQSHSSCNKGNKFVTPNRRSNRPRNDLVKTIQNDKLRSLMLPSDRLRHSSDDHSERGKLNTSNRKNSNLNTFHCDEEIAFDIDLGDSDSTLDVNKTNPTTWTPKTSAMSSWHTNKSSTYVKFKQDDMVTPPRGIIQSSPYVDYSPLSLSLHSSSCSSSINGDLNQSTCEAQSKYDIEQDQSHNKINPKSPLLRSFRGRIIHPLLEITIDNGRQTHHEQEILKDSYSNDSSNTIVETYKNINSIQNSSKKKTLTIWLRKSLIIRSLVLILIYCVSAFVFMIMTLPQYPIDDKIEKMRRFQVNKAREAYRPTVINYEARSNRRMTIFQDSHERLAIKRTMGGIYPIYSLEQEEKRFNKLNKRRSSGLGDLDFNMYDMKRSSASKMGHSPRSFSSDQRYSASKSHVVRELSLYPTVFSDNTQLYGIRESGDPALSKMEPLIEDKSSECTPMADWQTAYHPTCNGMHEMDLVNLNGAKMVGKKGYWRSAWKVDLGPVHASKPMESLILKTPKYDHNFEQAYFDHDRVDAQAMERMTFSPHVINIFGFCGRSVMSEFADGQRLGSLVDKSKKRPLKRLKIAHDIATGLSHVHFGLGDKNASFVHLDVNPANIVAVDNTLKVNDFNIGIMLKRNITSGAQCGFPAQFPNPQWRSPEEVSGSSNLNEKVDVFSMGHIFFRMICGHEPWNKLEIGGKPSSETLQEKVKSGILPRIPDQILNTSVPEEKVIRDAMLACYTVDPKERPSSKEVADFLGYELSKLSSQAKSKVKTEKKKQS